MFFRVCVCYVVLYLKSHKERERKGKGNTNAEFDIHFHSVLSRDAPVHFSQVSFNMSSLTEELSTAHCQRIGDSTTIEMIQQYFPGVVGCSLLLNESPDTKDMAH